MGSIIQRPAPPVVNRKLSFRLATVSYRNYGYAHSSFREVFDVGR